MGTRNLTMVIDKVGDTKIAQYGQWDGYPEGQGKTILNFCREKGNLDKLQKMLPLCKFFNRCNDIDAWLEDYDSKCPRYTNEPDNRTKEMITWFENFCTRDLGGDILNSVAYANLDELPQEHNGKIYLRDESEFGQESLFCEYAYCVNFNTNKLMVFEGFNKDKSLEHEFFVADQEEVDKHIKEFGYGYYGCKLIKEYDLNDLPTAEDFVKELREIMKGEEDE